MTCSHLGIRLSLVLLGAAPALARQDAPVAEIERTTRRYLLQDEDWSGLRGVERSELGWSDRLKFVPLNEDGSNYATFGGRLQRDAGLVEDVGFLYLSLTRSP